MRKVAPGTGSHFMKTKKVRQKKAKIGASSSRMKAVIKEIRKQYGPMLKKLAE